MSQSDQIGRHSQEEEVSHPMTGVEYLESLRDQREVWIYGERVKDVTVHPAFRNQARMVARMYDALHHPDTKAQLTCTTDTGSAGYTHRFFKASHNVDEMVPPVMPSPRGSALALVGWDVALDLWVLSQA